VRDSRQSQAHFDPGQRPGQHEIVEVPKMPNAEHFARKLSQSGPKGQVEVL
jgi:hypothetical protein